MVRAVKNIELFGGLAKKMPYTVAFTFVGSLALAKVPLTNGFVGEWFVLQSFITLAKSCIAQDIRLWTALSFYLLRLLPVRWPWVVLCVSSVLPSWDVLAVS